MLVLDKPLVTGEGRSVELLPTMGGISHGVCKSLAMPLFSCKLCRRIFFNKQINSPAVDTLATEYTGMGGIQKRIKIMPQSRVPPSWMTTSFSLAFSCAVRVLSSRQSINLMGLHGDLVQRDHHSPSKYNSKLDVGEERWFDGLFDAVSAIALQGCDDRNIGKTWQTYANLDKKLCLGAVIRARVDISIGPFGVSIRWNWSRSRSWIKASLVDLLFGRKYLF